eukprot:1806308-Rhodomonas_salina.2
MKVMQSHSVFDSHLHDHAGGGKHGNAAVLDLGLASPAEVKPVAEAERVKADVANEGSVEILGAVSSRDGVNAKALEHTLLVELHGGAPRHRSAWNTEVSRHLLTRILGGSGGLRSHTKISQNVHCLQLLRRDHAARKTTDKTMWMRLTQELATEDFPKRTHNR